MGKILCGSIIVTTILIGVIVNMPFHEKYVSAIFGFIGVISGAIIGIVGNIINEWYKNKPNKDLENQRMELLKNMLNNPEHPWRNLSTLSNVIGASKDETKRLLIKIGARGSEKNNEKKELWGLISKNPLPKNDGE